MTAAAGGAGVAAGTGAAGVTHGWNSWPVAKDASASLATLAGAAVQAAKDGKSIVNMSSKT